MNEKVDKGFELIYWNLSYRRKFVRTLWMLPLCIVLIGFMLWIGQNMFIKTILPIVILILYIVQLSYTYIKWRKCEQS